LNGFVTPTTAVDGVDSTISIFAGEGDLNILGDYAILTNQDGYDYDLPFVGTSYFDSSIEDVPNRNPIIANNNGIDIHTTQVGTSAGADRPIKTNHTSATLTLGSDGDVYMPSMVAFATELYVPLFCFDYAYKQQGKYFTEENNGTKKPEIIGDIVSGEPIEVTLFVRNQVDSDILVQNILVNVTDINTSQAAYINNTTKVAKTHDLVPYNVTVSSDDDHISDIPIVEGTDPDDALKANEYFYIYYQIDPITSSIDMPINASMTYTLVIDGLPIDYTSVLGEKMHMCPSTSLAYDPSPGVFNVVHSNYYPYTDGNNYYNLPTQVTKREGNFKIIALADDYTTLRDRSTMVSVELIDAAAFHTTDASCSELESSISEQVWMVFGTEDGNTSIVDFNQTSLQAAINDNRTDLINTSDFYSIARENAAFRISYALNGDNDGLLDLIKAYNSQGDFVGWNLANFPSLNGNCNQDMDGNLNNVDTISTWCNNAGTSAASSMSPEELVDCQKCIYGLNTGYLCSRDNFAIRPEAFMIKIDDQNQTNSTLKARIADNVTGVPIASLDSTQTELSAGYTYSIELNATNHLGNESSIGYTKTYGGGYGTDVEYQWSPTGTSSGCNDDANISLSFKMVDGDIDINSSVPQVGEYTLHMEDTSWTSVDSDPLFMQHHNSTGFLSSATKDCANSSATQAVNSATLNGCNISSLHTNSSAVDLEYKHYNIEFHPYSFDLTGITSSTGLTHDAINANSFVYMSDMSVSPVDENMSYHLNGTIRAAGEDNSSLSNFVDNCYAKPISIDLNTATLNQPVPFQFRFHSIDTTGADISTQDDNVTGTSTVINLLTTAFPKDFNGSANTILNLNYDRNNSFEVNPETVTFNNYNVDCTNAAADCTFNADLIATKTAQGREDLNNTIRYYYGRTHAPRNRFVGPGPHNAFIYYEVYCNGTTVGGSQCLKDRLQNGLNSRVTDDPRWFRNEQHIVASHGNSGVDNTQITQKNAANVSSATLINATGQTTAPLTYNENRDYPYKATMENNASRFLIYNKYDTANTNTTNEFEVEFVSGTSNWAGKSESTTTTGGVGTQKTNRRSMW